MTAAAGLPVCLLCDVLAQHVSGLNEPVPTRFVNLISRHRSIGRNYYEITRRDRGYLTDLRLKRYREPQQFFEREALRILSAGNREATLPEPADSAVARISSHLGKSQSGRSFDPTSFVRSAIASNSDLATQAMCFYVNSLGSWEDGATLARTVYTYRHEVPDTDEGGRLLAVSGYALCIVDRDRRARELWQRAYDNMVVAYDRFFLTLRVATAELKRYHDQLGFTHAVDRAERAAALLASNGHSPEDSAFAQALVLNLRALESTVTKRYGEARDRLDLASHIVAELPFNKLTLPRDLAERYAVMILENQGLLDARVGRWASASAHFRDAVLVARTRERNSLPEALTLLSVAYLKQELFASARRPLLEAAALLHDDASPRAYGVVCRLLGLAFYALGDERTAADWLAAERAYGVPDKRSDSVPPPRDGIWDFVGNLAVQS